MQTGRGEGTRGVSLSEGVSLSHRHGHSRQTLPGALCQGGVSKVSTWHAVTGSKQDAGSKEKVAVLTAAESRVRCEPWAREALPSPGR